MKNFIYKLKFNFCKYSLHNWKIDYSQGERTCKWCGKKMVGGYINSSGVAGDETWVEAPKSDHQADDTVSQADPL